MFVGYAARTLFARFSFDFSTSLEIKRSGQIITHLSFRSIGWGVGGGGAAGGGSMGTQREMCHREIITVDWNSRLLKN
jgi:hypothetical protein